MINKEIIDKIKPGAKIRVYDKTGRFEGIVIARKHGQETGATFTVRATVAGVGVEKVFPIHSPVISKVEIIHSPKKPSRAKIYYIRKLSPRKIRQKLGIS